MEPFVLEARGRERCRAGTSEDVLPLVRVGEEARLDGDGMPILVRIEYFERAGT